MKFPPLPYSFYNHDDVVTIAKDLLGKVIVSKMGGETTAGIIVETEAYKAPDDRASHAYNYRRTPRNETMYGDAGICYMYRCYGVHDMFNVVTGQKNLPHAILIRAIEPLIGLDIMQKRRGLKLENHHLTGGPGKVCVAMGLTVDAHDSLPLYKNKSEVMICEGNEVKNIKSSARVGMSHHTGSCAYRLWRFYINENKWVSRPLNVKYDF